MIGYGYSYFISTVLDSNTSSGNPPINTVAPVLSGNTTFGSLLSSTTGTWTGTAPITYSYQWKRNGNDIVGATSSVYTIQLADSGAALTCQVTATNIDGSASAISNTITANTFVAPVNTVAPALSGTAQQGQTLTSSNGTWTGTSPITYTYQWFRGASPIGSATNSTYTIVTADVGQSIKCTVTATNSIGSASADSNTVTPTWETDAQAFITAAAITDPTQQSAINQLVVDLKGYNVWTKMKAVYPIVGGSASSHAVNLKTPGTYNMTFATGWTHSSTGMTPNGATYADTSLNINTVMSLNSMAFGVYSRTNTAAGNKAHGAETPYTEILERNASNVAYASINDNGFTGVTVASSDSRGFFQASRTAINALRIVRNTTHATSTAVTSSKPNLNFYFGASAVSLTGAFVRANDRQIAFGYIADGFTQTECDNLYTAVQAFQTTLSRQI